MASKSGPIVQLNHRHVTQPWAPTTRSYLGRSRHEHAHIRLYFRMVPGLKYLIQFIFFFPDYLIHRERCQLQARRSAELLKVITRSHKFPPLIYVPGAESKQPAPLSQSLCAAGAGPVGLAVALITPQPSPPFSTALVAEPRAGEASLSLCNLKNLCQTKRFFCKSGIFEGNSCNTLLILWRRWNKKDQRERVPLFYVLEPVISMINI